MKNTKRVLAFLVGAAMMMPMVSAESANEYEATAQGFGGPVTVKITVDGGKVTAATITGEKETPAIGGEAIKMLSEKLIGVSSADEVDAISNATITSTAVKNALADCLRQASGEEKTAAALVDGLPLRIEGGSYQLCDGKEEACGCGGCRRHLRACSQKTLMEEEVHEDRSPIG